MGDMNNIPPKKFAEALKVASEMEEDRQQSQSRLRAAQELGIRQDSIREAISMLDIQHAQRRTRIYVIVTIVTCLALFCFGRPYLTGAFQHVPDAPVISPGVSNVANGSLPSLIFADNSVYTINFLPSKASSIDTKFSLDQKPDNASIEVQSEIRVQSPEDPSCFLVFSIYRDPHFNFIVAQAKDGKSDKPDEIQFNAVTAKEGDKKRLQGNGLTIWVSLEQSKVGHDPLPSSIYYKTFQQVKLRIHAVTGY